MGSQQASTTIRVIPNRFVELSHNMKKTYPLSLRAGIVIVLFLSLFGHVGAEKIAAANKAAVPASGKLASAPGLNQMRTGPTRFSAPQAGMVVQKATFNLTATPGPTQPPATPTATAVAPSIPSGLWAFRQQVLDGKSGMVQGVYVDGILALRVLQQPQGNWNFVSEETETATQFQVAAQNGVTGLLAHNFLSGKQFFDLALGQQVFIIKGDGKLSRYQITDIQRYQKVDSTSLYSDLIDLKTGKRLSTNDVISRVYSGPDHVTFQTCIEKDGNWTWGLIFIIATPV